MKPHFCFQAINIFHFLAYRPSFHPFPFKYILVRIREKYSFPFLFSFFLSFLLSILQRDPCGGTVKLFFFLKLENHMLHMYFKTSNNLFSFTLHALLVRAHVTQLWLIPGTRIVQIKSAKHRLRGLPHRNRTWSSFTVLTRKSKIILRNVHTYILKKKTGRKQFSQYRLHSIIIIIILTDGRRRLTVRN